jgi:hypothetical protein
VRAFRQQSTRTRHGLLAPLSEARRGLLPPMAPFPELELVYTQATGTLPSARAASLSSGSLHVISQDDRERPGSRQGA